jgi:hypothetical protein
MALDTIPELLSAIERLPADEQRRARARVAAAVERPAGAARAALGLLALDIAPQVVDDEVVIDLTEPAVAAGG